MSFIFICQRPKFDFLNDSPSRIFRLLLEPKEHCKSKRKKTFTLISFKLFQLVQTSNESDKCYAMGFSVGAIKEE